jgi:hypothetical protein
MKLERGCRRITLVLSVVIGLWAWLLCFVLISDGWDYECRRYSMYKDDYENITYFWDVWDANGWSRGKRSVVKNFLESKSRKSSAPFEIRGETVYLDADDVFPGIYMDMLDLPLDSLDEKAKTAKEKAYKTIEKNIKSHELWGNKRLSEIICLSILASLPAGLIGFLAVWFFFFLLRWLVRGFCSSTDETCK